MSTNDLSQEEAVDTLDTIIERIKYAAFVAELPDDVEIFSDSKDAEGNTIRVPVVGSNREYLIYGMKAIVAILTGDDDITPESSAVCQQSE